MQNSNSINTFEETPKSDSLRPALADEEIVFFKNIIIDCKEYFEFGIGGSTVYVYENSYAKIYGVDSSLEWIQKVEQSLTKDTKVNFVKKFFHKERFKLKYINIGKLSTWGNPLDSMRKKYWPRYSKAIFQIANKPDVILIDGRFRVACAAQVVLFSIKKKIKPKILLHDCIRKEYKKIYDILTPVSIVKSDFFKKNGLQLFEIDPYIDIKFVEKIYEEYKYEVL